MKNTLSFEGGRQRHTYSTSARLGVNTHAFMPHAPRHQNPRKGMEQAYNCGVAYAIDLNK